MMADAANKSSARIFAFILFFRFVTSSSAFSCVDGTYEHEGRACCRCGIGMRVIEHCITDLQRGVCEPCGPETYMTEPNGQMLCEPCTSCSHIHGNQVENTACTSGRDRTCRCKDDHFCPGTGICTVCNPCTKCGAEGIKVACKGNNDTVCNEKNEGGSHVGKTIGIVVGVIGVIAVIAVIVFLYKKRQCGHGDISEIRRNNNEDEVKSFIPHDVDLEPHFPDLLTVIGWKDMQDIAFRCSIPNTIIESCQLNHPGDAHEQTLELLRNWNEKQGRGAGNKLIQILQDTGKKKKAQKVTNILLRTAKNNSLV